MPTGKIEAEKERLFLFADMGCFSVMNPLIDCPIYLTEAEIWSLRRESHSAYSIDKGGMYEDSFFGNGIVGSNANRLIVDFSCSYSRIERLVLRLHLKLGDRPR